MQTTSSSTKVDYHFLSKIVRRHVLFGVVPSKTLVARIAEKYQLGARDRVRLQHLLTQDEGER